MTLSLPLVEIGIHNTHVTSVHLFSHQWNNTADLHLDCS